jgi:hypothetical protein
MKIQCNCGKFKAEIKKFDGNTPGRLVCYCDDCQNYLKKLGREDILDPYGGTEIIPVYPNHLEILEGQEYLKCNILSEKGLNRWSVTCCNTPVANTMANFAWAGIPAVMYTNTASDCLKKMGPIKSRIRGEFKKGNPPFKVSEKMGIKDALAVLPFILKGFMFRKFTHSPFFKSDRKTPIKKPFLLS